MKQNTTEEQSKEKCRDCWCPSSMSGDRLCCGAVCHTPANCPNNPNKARTEEQSSKAIFDMELRQKIYDILYKKSTVDVVRILHEDVWPIDQLLQLITDREKELLEDWEVAIRFSQCDEDDVPEEERKLSEIVMNKHLKMAKEKLASLQGQEK